VLDVDAGGGPVVGDDRRHGLAAGRQVGGAHLVRYGPPIGRPDVEEVAEEGVRRGTDHALGQTGRLGHQIEVEADGGGDAVHHLPHVQGRQDIEARQVGDRLGVVECGTEGHQGLTVMSGQRESLVPEFTGQRHDVRGHGPLGVDGAVGLGRLVTGAVAAQVGADHGVDGGEVGGHMAPHQVGLREAVQQDDGRAGTADDRVQEDPVGDGDAVVIEAGDDRCHDSAPFDAMGEDSPGEDRELRVPRSSRRRMSRR
jgi:hypothetical protein